MARIYYASCQANRCSRVTGWQSRGPTPLCLLSGLQAMCDGLMALPLLPKPGFRSRAALGSQPSQDRSEGDSLQGGDTPQYAQHAVLGAVVMHDSSCLWSSLGKDDSAALVALAAGALAPLLPPQQSAWKKLKGAALATAGRCDLSVSHEATKPNMRLLDVSLLPPQQCTWEKLKKK